MRLVRDTSQAKDVLNDRPLIVVDSCTRSTIEAAKEFAKREGLRTYQIGKHFCGGTTIHHIEDAEYRDQIEGLENEKLIEEFGRQVTKTILPNRLKSMLAAERTERCQVEMIRRMEGGRRKVSPTLHETKEIVKQCLRDCGYISDENVLTTKYYLDAIDKIVRDEETNTGGWAPGAHLWLYTEFGLPSEVDWQFWDKVRDSLAEKGAWFERVNTAVAAIYLRTDRDKLDW